MKRYRIKTAAKSLGDLGSKMVGFRLDLEHRKLLYEQAERAGLRPNLFARYVVVQALRHPERISVIEEAVLQVADHIRQVRADTCVVTEALLVTAGGISQADAKSWVKAYLKPE